MARKTWKEHVIDILYERGTLHASVIKDILFDRVGTDCPSVREVTTMLKQDRRIQKLSPPAGTTQIKKWKLKNP
tara:strand:+ start:1369 stop:1590 length:222 start_codon:yes stop_codon:yes gene_type:complete